MVCGAGRQRVEFRERQARHRLLRAPVPFNRSTVPDPAPEESIRDLALAPDGARRVEWARERMPVLRAIGTGVSESRTLRGRGVGICLVLEPKTACLALALRDAGAAVAVRASASETDD